MTQNARGMTNLLLMHTVRTPARQFTLSREQAHPLLVARLRQMADMPPEATDDAISLNVAGHPWDVRVAIAARGTGPR